MNSFIACLICISVAGAACSKADSVNTLPVNQVPASKMDDSPRFPKYKGKNPILGKWLFGKYERHCGTAININENNNGNFIEFRDNDSTYATYVTDNSFGFDHYAIIDSNTVLLNGIVQEIISIDEHHFTVHYEEQNGFIKQWMTYLAFQTEQ